jgi:DNA-directed RNA polymerase
MPNPAQIAEQVELERDQIRQGLEQLRSNTKKLEEKSYASATVYGISSIDSLLPLVVERIEHTAHRIKTRKNGRSFKEIQTYLVDLEPLAAAAIACKLTFDKVFSCKEGSNALVQVCESIGNAVEDECQMRHYEQNAPGLLKVLKDNYWHKSIGTNQKIKVISTLMNRYDVKKWNTWGVSNRVKLGAWLLDCVMETSGWFYKDMRVQGKRRINYVRPTPEFLEIKDQVMHDFELFAPLAYPMLIEPNDWTTDGRHGGYLLNEVMRGYPMVRRGNQGSIQGDTPVAFLNKLQKVGYRINPFIADIAELLQKRQISVGKFIPIIDLALPPKPVDIATNKDARKSYRRAAAEVMNTNASAFRRSCRSRMTMKAVSKFRDRESFYLPWSFDYRGRAYPIPAFLTPQDTDFGKSLLRFSEESVMNKEAEDWLSFQVATTYGLDKSTMSERLEWTNNNHDLISRVAIDPIDNLPDWEGAEEPWQFAAACDEFYHCVIKKDRTTTGLMVATDATASGLQILAGLAMDKSTAELVNVVPSERPVDAYKVVADISKPNIPEFLRPFWDRKCTKRTVMTIPYNSKPFSNRAYIREALSEKGIKIEKDDLTQTVQAVRGAMNKIVPGPMSVMRWIETEVSKAITRGDKELSWVTPSGFVVNQRLMKKQIERLQLQLLGKCEMYVATDETDQVDRNRHKAATAPNLIHSLDSSLLCLATIRFDAPIATIHDSVLCRATDMSCLSTLVRETYMHLFAKHDFLTDFANQINAETEPPIIGDLQPETVIDSTYFFC